MFDGVFGHKAVKERLVKTLPLSGTHLFHGPPSVGKRTVAFEAARYSLCIGLPSDECTCRSCTRFGRDHPDFLCIGQSDRVRVNDADRLLEFSSLRPFLSKKRVAVIDNADTATWEAANRMLKTLEEPAEDCIYILVSSRPEGVLATLRYRSVATRFESLSQEDLVNIVWKKLGFDLPKARIIGWIAGSSADVFANAGLYLKYRDVAMDFVRLLSDKDPLVILDHVEKVERKDVAIFVDTLMSVLTDMTLIRLKAGEIANLDLQEDLSKIAAKLHEKALIALTSIAGQVKKYAGLNINLSLAMKSAAIRMQSIAGAGAVT